MVSLQPVKNGNVVNGYGVSHSQFMKTNDIQNMVKTNNYPNYNGKDRESMFHSYPQNLSKNNSSKKSYGAQVRKMYRINKNNHLKKKLNTNTCRTFLGFQ